MAKVFVKGSHFQIIQYPENVAAYKIQQLFNDKVINRRVTARGREQHCSPKERLSSAAGKRQKAVQ